MSKIIDLTGQKIERWTVIERASNNPNRTGARWLCECECGTKKIIRGDALRAGKSKSCGCLAREKAAETIKKNAKPMMNLINQKFGLLTVIGIEKDENNHSKWKCQCDCGNITYATSHDLTSGHKKSCGCITQSHLVGQRFGLLTVLEQTEKRNPGNREIIWKCKCDCGSIIEVSTHNLICSHTMSCGCIKSQGELKIINILNENNILYEREKTFNLCKDEKLLRFDFYLPEFNILIEYDGEQHFNPIKFGNMSEEEANNKFLLTKKHDDFKNQWCKENNILLIRIPYWHFKNLSLKDLLQNSLYQI